MTIPIGAVIVFAGSPGSNAPDPSSWLLCDGRSLDPQDAAYASLFKAIGTVNGGDGVTSFRLPDYRGQFLRGTDHGAGHDPDAASRTSPYPGAAVGDAVGSFQSGATGKPGTPIQSSVANLPSDGHHHTADAVLTHEVAAWHSSADDISLEGGDAETRPVNVYADYYIRYA